MQKKESVRNILATARFLLTSLTPAEKRVAEFVLASPREVSRMSLQKLAKRCECGEATVVRLCRTIGLSGYTQFKEQLAVQLLNPPAKNDEVKLSASHRMEEILESVFELNILNLRKTLEMCIRDRYDPV